MLEKIKKVAGINNNDFDDLIEMYIDTSKSDLMQSGIVSSKIKEEDALISSAIISFVMSKIDATNFDLYLNSYNLQKDALRHYTDYNS